MESLTWKIVASAPFGGLAPKFYRNTNCTYGQANQFNSMSNVDISDLSCIKQAPGLAAFTIVNQFSTPVNTYETLTYILDKKIGTLGYAISNSYLWSINLSTHTLTAIRTLPSGSVGKSISYYDGNLYYFHNTTTASDIGKHDFVSYWADDWGSAQSATPANVFKANEGAVSSSSLVKMVIGNDDYVGLYDGTSLSMNAVELDTYYNIASICSSETLTYVGMNGPEGAIIGIYNNTFDFTDETGAIVPLNPDAVIVLKYDTIGGMFYKNGIVLVAYKKSGFDAFTLGYISGSSVVDIIDLDDTTPSWKKITYWNDNFLVISDGVVYQYGRADTTLNYAVGSLFALSGATCIANVDGTLLIANATNLYYNSGLATACQATSLTFNVSDAKHVGFVDDIQVRTDDLNAAAKCKIQIIKNKGTASDDIVEFVVDGEHVTRHYGDIKLNGCEELKYKVDWSNGSSTYNCPVREIIINGHLNERGGKNITTT